MMNLVFWNSAKVAGILLFIALSTIFAVSIIEQIYDLGCRLYDKHSKRKYDRILIKELRKSSKENRA